VSLAERRTPQFIDSNQRRVHRYVLVWLLVVQVTSRLIGRWGGHHTDVYNDCVIGLSAVMLRTT